MYQTITTQPTANNRQVACCILFLSSLYSLYNTQVLLHLGGYALRLNQWKLKSVIPTFTQPLLSFFWLCCWYALVSKAFFFLLSPTFCQSLEKNFEMHALKCDRPSFCKVPRQVLFCNKLFGTFTHSLLGLYVFYSPKLLQITFSNPQRKSESHIPPTHYEYTAIL